MMYPFAFVVVSECDGDTSNYIRESGMGLAENYCDAVDKIINYYGTDLICIKHLEVFQNGPELILLTEDIINEYRKTDFGMTGMPCDINGNSILEVCADEC